MVIEQAYIDKLDGHITNDFWKERTALWHAQRDELRVQQVNLDKKNDEFYELSNSLLEFLTDAYPTFLEANSKEKRMLLNLMVSNFSFKDQKLVIELNDTFGTIAKNVKMINGALTGTKLELFINNLYNTVSSKKSSITMFSLNEFKKAV